MFGTLFLIPCLVLTMIMAVTLRRQVIKGMHMDNPKAWGLRTRATTSSQEAWEQSHRAVEPLLRATIVIGLVTLVLFGVFWIGHALTEASVFKTLMLIPSCGYLLQACIYIAAQVKAHRVAKKINEASVPQAEPSVQ